MTGAQYRLDYQELPVVGYLLDGKHTGFKTPVLQNGREPAIQDSDTSGTVTGFVACGEDDLERIYRSNYPIGVKSQVGKEVVHVFKTQNDTFYETKSKIVSRLLVSIREDESMTASDAINVMIFARLPFARISAAIDVFANNLKEKGIPNTDKWAARFKSRVSSKSETKDSVENAVASSIGATSESLSFHELEAAAELQIKEIDEPELQKRAFGRLDFYYKIRSSLASKSKEIQDQGFRDLYSLSAQIDALGLSKLSFLINFLFCLSLWRNFIKWNNRKYNRKIRIDTPSSRIAHAARLDASERLIGMIEVFSHFRPFTHKGKDGVRLNLPRGILLSGTITSRDFQGNLLVECGSNIIEIQSDHVSTVLHNTKQPVGEKIFFTMRGSNFGTCRGEEFVSSVIELIFPTRSDVENPLEVTIGASGTWALLQTSEAKTARLIVGQGVYIEQVREIASLRRLTAIKKMQDTEAAVREFCRASWRELIVEYNQNVYVLSLISRSEVGNFEQRKYRTFDSMWKKIFPNAEMQLRYKHEGDSEWRLAENH